MRPPHRQQELHRLARTLVLGGLLLSGVTAAAQTEAVPDWAAGWKETFLAGKQDGTVQLTGGLSSRVLGSGPQQLFAVLELRVLEFPQPEPPPASVVLIIDRSFSTQGRRLLIAKKVAQELLSRLGERDRLAIILASDNPEVLPSQPVSAENREKLKAHVEGTLAEGRSDLSAALEAAVKELTRPEKAPFYRQVLLLSDGQPTDGMVDAAGLAEIAREARENHNVHVSTVAIGEDANLELMAGMARQGWGFAARLNDSSQAARVANRQRLELLRRAASSVELTVKVAPSASIVEVYGHDATVTGNTVRLAVGELGPGEVLRVALQLSTQNLGKQVRPLALVQADLQYENAFTERLRLQSLDLKGEVNPGKAQQRGALDTETVKHASLALVERNVARADETAEDGDLPGARKLLDDTREALKKLGAQARLAVADALVLLDTRGRQVLQQKRPELRSTELEKKKKKKR